MIRKCIIFVVLFFGIKQICHKLNAGFRLNKIEGALAYNPHFETRSHLDNAAIDAILSQPFYFLGSGAQSFAFESADKKTVLKFMKQSKRKPMPWLEALPLPPGASHIRNYYMQKRKKRLHDLLTSARIACDELYQETGVLYAHLNTSAAAREKITLYDKIGIRYTVDVDNSLFVLQKRGSTLLDQPLEPKTIAGMIEHVKKSCKKGIAHLDPLVDRNFGIYNGSVFTIDFGSLKYDEKLKTFPYLQRELFSELLTLRYYIKKNNPELLGYFDETMQKELATDL